MNADGYFIVNCLNANGLGMDSEDSDQVRYKPANAATDASYRFDISELDIIDIILTRQLVSQRGSTVDLHPSLGPVPLFFTCARSRFSHICFDYTFIATFNSIHSCDWCFSIKESGNK